MIDPQLAALMTQMAYAYPVTGTDAYGQPAYTPDPVVIPCHVVGRLKEVVDKTGEAVVSTGQLITTKVYNGLDDRAILDVPEPADETGRRRVNIIAIITRYDENGPHHQVIYYGPAGGTDGDRDVF